MLKKLASLVKEDIVSEADVHYHVEEERASIFHAFDDGTVEAEYLHLICSLVLAHKPKFIFESGTYRGIAAKAVGMALRENGFGQLITVENKEELVFSFRRKLKEMSLDYLVHVVSGSSLEFCGNTDTVFDMAFFDTGIDIRCQEFYKLWGREKLSPEAILVFHDTSSYRLGEANQGKYLAELATIANDYCSGELDFPLSRGIKILQLKKTARVDADSGFCLRS